MPVSSNRRLRAVTRSLIPTPTPPLVALEAAAAPMEPPRRPNICFVLTDDQGYGELGCHGNTVIQTPAIDALYADAVRVRCEPLLHQPPTPHTPHTRTPPTRTRCHTPRHAC